MSYPKNAATPKSVTVGQVILIADGTIQTSGCSVRVNLDDGGWGAGGGSLGYDATSGVVTYAPIQAETNGDVLEIAVYKAACLGCSTTVLMDNQTGDSYAVVAHADHGNAKLVRSTTPANTLTVDASHRALSDLASILGTALTETAGYLAGAFKKFFNIETPTGTVNSLPDAVAGAAGGVSIVGSKMDFADTLTQTGVTDLKSKLGTIPASGNWNVGKTGYTLTTQNWNTVTPDAAGVVASALGDGTVKLHGDYDAAKTAAQAGDAMTLADATHQALERAMRYGTNVWFVSKAGNDGTGTGSAKAPLLTIGQALTVASAGDEIIFGPGTYTEQLDGSALASIQLTGSGWGCIITSAQDYTLQYGDCWRIRNCSIRNTKCNESEPAAAVRNAVAAGAAVVFADVYIVAADMGVEHWDANLLMRRCVVEAAEHAVLARSDPVDYSRVTRLDACVLKTSGWTYCNAETVNVEGSTLIASHCTIDAECDTGAGAYTMGVQAVYGELINTAIRATDTSGVAGVRGVFSNGDVRITGGSITTSGGTVTMDLYAAADKKIRVSGCDYDTAKTTGTIVTAPPLAAILSDTDANQQKLAEATGTLANIDNASSFKADVSALATILTAVNALQNNTRVKFLPPGVMERPDSGSTAYKLELYLYDSDGNMEAPDSTPVIAVTNQSGTDRSSNLSALTEVSTGYYTATYTLASDATMEQLVWDVTIVEGGATRHHGALSLIVDTTAVDFTAADRTKLTAIHGVVPAAAPPTKAQLDSAETAIKAAKMALSDLTEAQIDAIETQANKLKFAGTDVKATLDSEKVALSATGLDAIPVTEPAGAASTFREMIVQVWRRFFKKATMTSSEIKTYADDGTTVVTTQTVSDDGTTQNQGGAS